MSFKLPHILSRVAVATAGVLAPVAAFAQEAAPAVPVPDKADTVFMFVATLCILPMILLIRSHSLHSGKDAAAHAVMD